jgi:hypothetical protein
MKRFLIALFALLLFPALAQAQVIGGVKSFIVANNTTSVAVCPGSCTLTGYVTNNNSATLAYLRFYAATQANVTCGTNTPSDRALIPTNTSGATLPTPVYYPSGLTVCVTTGIADNDTGAPAASTYLVSIYTK